MTHPASLPDEALLKECDFSRGRASGPGGQHRNKVETAVVLTHTPTGIAGRASERRSQIENKRVALRRLRLNLATQFRTAPPAASGEGFLGSPIERSRDVHIAAHEGRTPSELWLSRRRGKRIVCSTNHHDYPALLAEALDVIAQVLWEPKPAAIRLGVSTSQLIKLAKNHPPAFEMWNRQRQTLGKNRLL